MGRALNSNQCIHAVYDVDTYTTFGGEKLGKLQETICQRYVGENPGTRLLVEFCNI